MCTDVMARGVAIPAVDWVIQFDPPLPHSMGVWLWVCTCVSSCMRAYIFSKSECVCVASNYGMELYGLTQVSVIWQQSFTRVQQTEDKHLYTAFYSHVRELHYSSTLHSNSL